MENQDKAQLEENLAKLESENSVLKAERRLMEQEIIQLKKQIIDLLKQIDQYREMVASFHDKIQELLLENIKIKGELRKLGEKEKIIWSLTLDDLSTLSQSQLEELRTNLAKFAHYDITNYLPKSLREKLNRLMSYINSRADGLK